MRVFRPRFGLALFIAVCTTQCSTYFVPDFGGATAAPPGLTLTVKSVQSGVSDTQATLVLSNHSNQPFAYTAGPPEKPWLEYSYSVGRAWVRPLSLRCGTGATTVTLMPGQTVEFVAYVPRSYRQGRVRVGIASNDGPFAVWSPVIDVITQTWGAQLR